MSSGNEALRDTARPENYTRVIESRAVYAKVVVKHCKVRERRRKNGLVLLLLR